MIATPTSSMSAPALDAAPPTLPYVGRTTRLGAPLGVPLFVDPRGTLVGAAINGALVLVLCRAAAPGLDIASALAVALSAAALLQLSAVLHEYGHLAAARRIGLPTGAVVFGMFGGYVHAAPREALERPAHTAAVVLAGPAATLLLWALFAAGAALLRTVAPEAALALSLSAALNLGLLLLNLMPVEPLDGGRLLRLARGMVTLRSAS